MHANSTDFSIRECPPTPKTAPLRTPFPPLRYADASGTQTLLVGSPCGPQASRLNCRCSSQPSDRSSQFAVRSRQIAVRGPRWRSFPPIHEISSEKYCHGSTSNSGPMQQVGCWKWTFLVQADKISRHPQPESIWQSGDRLPRSPIWALASFPSDTLISQGKTFVG